MRVRIRVGMRVRFSVGVRVRARVKVRVRMRVVDRVQVRVEMVGWWHRIQFKQPPIVADEFQNVPMCDRGVSRLLQVERGGREKI